MAADYSFFNLLVSGIADFGNSLKSIMAVWYVFNSDIIFYNNPKFIILGLSLFGFLGLLVYQFFRIKAKIGNFIEKKKKQTLLGENISFIFCFLELQLL